MEATQARPQQLQRHHPSQPLARSQTQRLRPPHPHALLDPPLLDALRPVVFALHAFLDDADAVRLLRTSRTAALTLLSGYTFTSIFLPDSLASLRHLRACVRCTGFASAS